MQPNPIYIAHNLHPAYQLRYGWTAWPSAGEFPAQPPPPFLKELSTQWEKDGLRTLEHAWKPDEIKFTFSAKPEVSPVLIAGRAKGRLQHALRAAGKPVKFSRKVSLRGIGHNTRETVEGYIRTQLKREDLADLAYVNRLKSQSIFDQSVDLSQPTQTNSGQFWYNLHLVLVVAERYRLGWEDNNMPALCRQISQKKGYKISSLSIMPDHLHLALRGNIDHSPEEIALAFQNNLAYKLGQCRTWEGNYYVGTFGEYTMRAVRR